MNIASQSLRNIARVLYRTFVELGFDPRRTLYFLRGFPIYWYQLLQFSQKNRHNESSIGVQSLFPCVGDRYQDAGQLDSHYFNQDLWAARKVYQLAPQHHIDIGSRIDGFVSHLLTFREVEVLDVRKLDPIVSGMRFRQMDLMKFEAVPAGICDSISCLHAIEHFGLGRYGDPVDPDGHLKGLKSITKLLEPGGTLLLSAPIGQERIEFNAHRVFFPHTLPDILKDNFELISYSFVDDQGTFHENVNVKDTPDLRYGCGLYEYKKYQD